MRQSISIIKKIASGLRALAAGAVVFGVYDLVYDQDIMAASTVLVAYGAFAHYGKREPELQYSLDPARSYNWPKFYDYDQFRSFSVMRENGQPAIALLPMKRFAPLQPFIMILRLKKNFPIFWPISFR